MINEITQKKTNKKIRCKRWNGIIKITNYMQMKWMRWANISKSALLDEAAPINASDSPCTTVTMTEACVLLRSGIRVVDFANYKWSDKTMWLSFLPIESAAMGDSFLRWLEPIMKQVSKVVFGGAPRQWHFQLEKSIFGTTLRVAWIDNKYTMNLAVSFDNLEHHDIYSFRFATNIWRDQSKF